MNEASCQINLRGRQLHMRPAQVIAEVASKYHSEIRAVNEHVDVNAKSLVEMIEFVAHMANSSGKFSFRAHGPDAKDAVSALEAAIEKHVEHVK